MASQDFEDPMDAVEESEIGDYDAHQDRQDCFQNDSQQTAASGGSVGNVMGNLFDNHINLQMTPEGMRKLLSRKTRSKPLLRLVCKGCLKSNQDPDDFISSDYLE